MDKVNWPRRFLLPGAMVLAFMAVAEAQTPVGGAFQVNTYTTNRQQTAHVAMEPDGDFVVVWHSATQDGDDYGVFAQRYAASGAPRGGEFRVNVHTTGFQKDPAVAVGSGGDFIVVWQSVQDGSNSSIQGRRFDGSGTPLGGEFLVNTYTTGFQYWPQVGRAADGRFVVSWVSPGVDGGSYGIAARRFDASGNPIGSEFVVNTYTTGEQVAGDLAVDANGNFVAVWEDFAGNRDGSSSAIFGQRFDASGNRVGSEFQVNTHTTGRQGVPSVSVSPAGGFVVAFQDPSADGFGYGVLARRYDAAGNAMGNDFVVNTYTTGAQSAGLGQQVAHDALGNFVVTWISDDGSQYGSFAQRFSASGALRGAEFRVNLYTPGSQRRPSVASDAVGNFVIDWQSPGQDGDDDGVFAQLYGGLGPAAMAVVDDSPGNLVLEPGETVEVRPTWRNVSGATLAFGGGLFDFTGPAGATYSVPDPVGDYGSVDDGATAQCLSCYSVEVSDPPTRPALHWDATAVESITPDTLGQQKQGVLHVGRSFDDVDVSSGFYRFIETLLHHGVTSGCSATAYCPGASTTRDAMAVFVLVAKEGAGYVPPACTTPMFDDVPASNPFCRWIEELARRAVVSGCGNDNYCPTDPVTREQMAVFVLRTLDPSLQPPACTTPIYTDVPATSGFCRWIEELTRRNVVTGCGPGLYCPGAPVTREQMGVFISATFGLSLYGL